MGRKITVLFASIIVCLYANCSNPEQKSNKISKENKVVIEVDYFPKKVKPGDKPFTFIDEINGKTLLSCIVPELKNPRLMSFKDYPPYEQDYIIDEGCTFVLTGDFNRDGYGDVAFVGKYDNPTNPKENSFFAIVTIKGNKIIREYFLKIAPERVCLLNEFEYKPKIDAIMLIFTFGSEECGFIYWTGEKWEFEFCPGVFGP